MTVDFNSIKISPLCGLKKMVQSTKIFIEDMMEDN